MSEVDAEELGISDNDWVEVYNDHGVYCARASVSARIPKGVCIVYHVPERTVGIPKSQVRGGRRAGGHNSFTRIHLKPNYLAGGYGQFSLSLQLLGANRSEPRHARHREAQNGQGGVLIWMFDHRFRWCSTSTSALAVTRAPSLARTSGPTARARNTCGGTMSRPSPVRAIPASGKTRRSTRVAGRRTATRSIALKGAGKPKSLTNIFHNPNMPVDRRLLRAVHLQVPRPDRVPCRRRPADGTPRSR